MLQRVVAAPNKHRLNDRFIGDLQPKEKPFLIWDTIQRGLVVQVQPSGTRSFKVIYTRRGVSRWYYLASANAIDVAQARTLANAVMYEVAQGKDPAAERKASRSTGTFEDVAARYAKHAAKKNKSWHKTGKLLTRYLLPKWGKLVVREECRSA